MHVAPQKQAGGVGGQEERPGRTGGSPHLIPAAASRNPGTRTGTGTGRALSSCLGEGMPPAPRLPRDPPSTGVSVPGPQCPPLPPRHPAPQPPAAGHSPGAVSHRQEALRHIPDLSGSPASRPGTQPPRGQHSAARTVGRSRGGTEWGKGVPALASRGGGLLTCWWAPASCSSKVVTRSRAARSRSRTCARRETMGRGGRGASGGPPGLRAEGLGGPGARGGGAAGAQGRLAAWGGVGGWYLLVQGLVVFKQRLEGLQHLHLTGDP